MKPEKILGGFGYWGSTDLIPQNLLNTPMDHP